MLPVVTRMNPSSLHDALRPGWAKVASCTWAPVTRETLWSSRLRKKPTHWLSGDMKGADDLSVPSRRRVSRVSRGRWYSTSSPPSRPRVTRCRPSREKTNACPSPERRPWSCGASTTNRRTSTEGVAGRPVRLQTATAVAATAASASAQKRPDWSRAGETTSDSPGRSSPPPESTSCSSSRAAPISGRRSFWSFLRHRRRSR